MVFSVGGAWLTIHLLLLLLSPHVSPALTSSSASDVTADVTAGQELQAPLGDREGSSREVPIGDMMPREAAEGVRMVADQSKRNSFEIEDVQVGCRELWAKRYISDGFCTSVKPLREVVCAGHCLPIRDLPWYAEFVALWTKARLKEWQCVEAVVRKKAVNLLCRNGEYRTYRIKVVKACKCEKTVSKRNRTERPNPKKNQRRGRKGRKGRKKGKKKKKKGRRRGGGGAGENRKPKEEVQGGGGQSLDQRQEKGGGGGQRQNVRDQQRQEEDARQESSDSGHWSSLRPEEKRNRDRSQGL